MISSSSTFDSSSFSRSSTCYSCLSYSTSLWKEMILTWMSDSLLRSSFSTSLNLISLRRTRSNSYWQASSFFWKWAICCLYMPSLRRSYSSSRVRVLSLKPAFSECSLWQCSECFSSSTWVFRAFSLRYKAMIWSSYFLAWRFTSSSLLRMYESASLSRINSSM